MPATPLGSLPSFNSSLHFLECASSNTDEDTVFTAESNPSKMNSVNGNPNSVPRMMDCEEGNIVSLLNVESPVPSTANDISSKWSQSRELQEAAYSDNQEMRSFRLTNLGSDLEGNEKFDHDGYILQAQFAHAQ